MNRINRAKVSQMNSWRYDALELNMAIAYPGMPLRHVVNLTLEEINDQQIEIERYEPILIDLEACQMLMDSLWNCGIRPTDGAGSAGAMVKAEQHIKAQAQEISHLWDLINKLTGAKQDG